MPFPPAREPRNRTVAADSAAGSGLSASLVASVDELPDAFWSAPPPDATRARLAELARDPRFDSGYVTIARQGTPVLALPMYAPQRAEWPDPHYDVPALLGLADRAPATGFCLLGGRADLRCTLLRAAGTDPAQLADAATLAVGFARGAAARSRRRCALLYVDADGPLQQAARSVGVAGSAPLGERYVIPDVGAGLPEYLSLLGASRRGIVRRDLRKLDQLGLRAEAGDWSAVLDESAPLIARVKQQHQQADLPALVRYRLSRRALDPDVRCVAFSTRQDGRLTAVTTGWVYGSTLELYEVGLADEPAADRGLCYLEVMFYAPLRLMWSLGLRTLDLSLASARPKTLRGAEPRPLAGVLLRAG